MKKTLTKAGAIGLAAATILTGLSFGPAAASAAPAATAISGPLRPLMFQTSGTTTFDYIRDFGEGRIGGEFGKTRDDALEHSLYAHLPEVGTTGPITADDGTCLDVFEKEAGNDGRPWRMVKRACSADRTQQMFEHLPGGQIESVAYRGNYMMRAGMYNDVIAYLQSGPLDSQRTLAAVLSASVSNISITGRSADLTGTALPGSTVIINDEQPADVDDDGNWSATVSGLNLGVNTMVLEQFEGSEKTADARVEIDLAVQPVTATATFDTDVTKKATLSGTAHPGADVVVEDADGVEIDRAPASPVDGTWELEIPAPNLGGDYPVAIHQLIDEEPNGEIERTIAYGEAVTITRPVPDAPHAGGPLTMRGTGEAGASVTVREQGGADVIGSKKVLPNRVWSLDTTDLDAGKHVLEVTQTGKGGNVTTSTITLNPDAVAPVTPVTVTSPVSGAEFDPNTSVRFTGTGEAGGIITVTPTNGAAPVTTEVRADGSWSVDRYLGNGPYTFDVTQVAGGVTSSVTGIALTPKNAAPIDQDFAITSPTTGSTVKNQLAPFTGTGAAGTTVRIHTTNFASSDITTVVKNDGTWSVNKWIGDGPYVIDITQEGRVTGAVRGFQLNSDVAVNLPFAITSPTAGDDVRSKVQTFTGTGRHGELVTIKATSPTGLAEVTGVVKRDGTWSINRFIGDGPYAFDVVQTKNGVESGAERDFRINQPAKRAGVTGPLVVTGPTDGSTFTANTQVAFTGTGTTGAVITVTPTAGAAVTTEVSEDGSWSVNRYLGDGPYTFTVTSTLDGVTETHPGTISLTPAP